ncbi:sulfite reductase subunit alpha [Luteimonas panaciterrae]|uniref:sulfite reductase subunit alpha n=1 Tax=Luteimonas panaciterrae TaxID=363885 RepID=UPI001CFA0A48|nr:sulfite reductase flavoprotein subunit alpha [Luteimonas panaciterrae]
MSSRRKSKVMSRQLLGNAAVLFVLLIAIVALLPLHDDVWWYGSPRAERWALAIFAIVLYAAFCGALWWRTSSASREARQALAASGANAGILVAWASQTGFAQQIAERTADSLAKAGVAVRLSELADIDASMLSAHERALFVVSTTGEGDAPDHALAFVRDVLDREVALSNLHYGILALGDRKYANFCGFGHRIEQWLRRGGATSMFDLIEVDNGDAGALRHWQHHLGLLADAPELPDWAPASYERWVLHERHEANPGSTGGSAYHIELRPPPETTPGWQAGDIAEIGPRNAPSAVAASLAALGIRGDTEVVRDGEKITIGELLARSHLPATSEAVTPDAQTLAQNLNPLPHREYSIASLPQDGGLHLLVRKMRRGDGQPGLGSGWLCDHALPGGEIALRIRSNPNFHPPAEERPMLLIGNGTGIAGLRAHLKARVAAGARHNWLVFGERNADRDYFYRDEIEGWRTDGFIEHLDLAFSRDLAESAEGVIEKRYVQHILRDRAERLRVWAAEGAAIYVCGSLEGMAPGVDAVLRETLGDAAVDGMLIDGRYRRDVY